MASTIPRRPTIPYDGKLLDMEQPSEIAPGIPRKGVPVLSLTLAQLEGFPFDAMERRLVAHVDGAASFEAVSSAAGATVLECAPAWRTLLRRGIVHVRSVT